MPNIRNFRINLAYDGSGFHGWQVQPGLRTVQETVEVSLRNILGHHVRVTASGRTDTGVHALKQVINFYTPVNIPEIGLLHAMNSVLPPDISVLQVETVLPAFHARFMAKSKIYVYIIDTSEILSPFLARYALHLPGNLNLDEMKISAQLLKGEHDFCSFMGAGSSVKTTVRNITVSDIFTKGAKVFFCIQGSGFLRHMVRNIIGTLILIGQRKIVPDDMKKILALKDRTFAGPTAPPQGLYLAGVQYEDNFKVMD